MFSSSLSSSLSSKFKLRAFSSLLYKSRSALVNTNQNCRLLHHQHLPSFPKNSQPSSPSCIVNSALGHHHLQSRSLVFLTTKSIRSSPSFLSVLSGPNLSARHLSSASSSLSTTFTILPVSRYLLQSSNRHCLSFNWNRTLSTSSVNMPPIKQQQSAEVSENIDELIASSHVVMFSFETCKFCDKAKQLLDQQNVLYREIVIDQETNGMKIYQNLQAKIDRTSVPQIFIGGQHIGGCDELVAKHESGELGPILRGHSFDYDLIVVGGGSGGLAASKEAASLGKTVVLLDFVTPTPQGTTWGLGGTCVNVGCIPKKLMHHASLVGQEIEDSEFFGWLSKDGKPLKENLKHDWGTLVQYVQNNIKGSNFTYKGLLRSAGVKYINAYGSFVEPHKIKITHKNGKEEFMTAKEFIISTGERPRYPVGVEGALQYSITSDDLFSLPYNPGKTLVVGASYVALECAGFLKGLGNDVSVMVRSILLRGFDRQCSDLIGNYMENVEHVRFIKTSVPKKIEQIEEGKPGRYRVTWTNVETQQDDSEEFNTVMFAIGRSPCTDNIGLENVGVARDKDGKIAVVNEQTNVPHIYAIGDILQGKPQLTPVAIEAGILLARRLYAGSAVQCDYLNVPTTVFTPLEYGCCGYTEEQAIQEFGADKIEVYHQYFSPTEWRLNYYDRPRTPLNSCYAKVITTRSLKNDPTEERLLGFHYVGPFAGEITQFLGIPLKLKATKADLDALIGIHPTCAEILTTLTVTKRSGKEPTQQGCCG